MGGSGLGRGRSCEGAGQWGLTGCGAVDGEQHRAGQGVGASTYQDVFGHAFRPHLQSSPAPTLLLPPRIVPLLPSLPPFFPASQATWSPPAARLTQSSSRTSTAPAWPTRHTPSWPQARCPPSGRPTATSRCCRGATTTRWGGTGDRWEGRTPLPGGGARGPPAQWQCVARTPTLA